MSQLFFSQTVAADLEAWQLLFFNSLVRINKYYVLILKTSEHTLWTHFLAFLEETGIIQEALGIPSERPGMSPAVAAKNRPWTETLVTSSMWSSNQV